MGTWYARLRERVPDEPVVRELIEAVERLPGIDAWKHAQDIDNRWTSIIAWGFALWMTRSLCRVELLQQKIAGEIAGLGSPDPDTFTELSGAGLCVALGAVDGERIPHQKTRTADWRLMWPSEPQVRVFFGVPYSSYINPVMKKGDHPQGRAERPFLVVVDIANLPGAFTEMPRILTGYLPLWNSISGILLYHDFSHVEKMGWLWRLINNPFAEVPLPEGLRNNRADLANTMETGLRLTREVDGRGVA
jgi:hypothetical protein